MIDSLVWLKENVEVKEMMDYVKWVNWKRQKEENNDRIKTAGFEAEELQRH
jgi:hypothetical protein